MSEYTKDQLKQFAVEAARKHGINPVFYLAQIEQESGWNPNAKSSAGAIGLAQFMPGTAKAFNLNPLDPIASLDAGAKYMAQLTKKFGDEDTARLAYNWGEGNVASYLKTGKGNKGRELPKEAAEYNQRIYARAGATPSWGNEARVAARTNPPAKTAMTEMTRNVPSNLLQFAPEEVMPQQIPLANFAQSQDNFFGQMSRMQPVQEEAYIPMQIRYALSNMWDEAEVDNG